MAQKLQEDSAAFQQRLAHLQTDLDGKHAEMVELSQAHSQLLAHSKATEAKLTASLQSAGQRVAELQAEAEAAAKQHEVSYTCARTSCHLHAVQNSPGLSHI